MVSFRVELFPSHNSSHATGLSVCVYLSLIDDEHYCPALAHRECSVSFERLIKCWLSPVAVCHTEGQSEVDGFFVYATWQSMSRNNVAFVTGQELDQMNRK